MVEAAENETDYSGHGGSVLGAEFYAQNDEFFSEIQIETLPTLTPY
jgi:hypothetical protein